MRSEKALSWFLYLRRKTRAFLQPSVQEPCRSRAKSVLPSRLVRGSVGQHAVIHCERREGGRVGDDVEQGRPRTRRGIRQGGPDVSGLFDTLCRATACARDGRMVNVAENDRRPCTARTSRFRRLSDSQVLRCSERPRSPGVFSRTAVSISDQPSPATQIGV